MYDLVIIGGGAAGAAATVYALQNQLNTLLLTEDSGKAGTQQHLKGQRHAEQLSGTAMLNAFQQAIIAADAVRYDRVLAVAKEGATFTVATQQHGTLACRALIIATGAAPIPLPVPGAHTFVNHGVGYSGITHAPLCAGKTVAVVGATTRAVRGALALSRVATQVYLILPSATALEQEHIRQLQRVPNLTVLPGRRITAIEGVSSVERVTVVDYEGEIAWLRVAAIFADLGLLPNSAAVRDLVETDAQGAIVVDERNATSVAGVFAAGDVTTAPCEHSLVAIGAGARAAVSAYEYLLMAALCPTTPTA